MEGLKYEYHKLKCSKYGRKILVEIGLIGVGITPSSALLVQNVSKRLGFQMFLKTWKRIRSSCTLASIKKYSVRSRKFKLKTN